MGVMFILIIASLIVAVGFLAAFLWAVKSGQFDDTATPSMRMLMDDGQPRHTQEQSDKSEKPTN